MSLNILGYIVINIEGGMNRKRLAYSVPALVLYDTKFPPSVLCTADNNLFRGEICEREEKKMHRLLAN